MEIKMYVDRIAALVAICYDDNDKKHEIPISLSTFKVGDVISVVFDDKNVPTSVKILKEETESRRADLAKKTKDLFNRNKNN